MDCSACCNIITDIEEFLSCSLTECCKKYHLLCIGDKNLTPESRNRWICPECRCAAKRGGDNSATPVGVTKKNRDPNVTHRAKVAPIPPVDLRKDEDTAILLQEMRMLRQDMTSMREQFSLEIASYDAKLSRSIHVIESYEAKLGEAVNTITSHETKIGQYAELVETLVGTISKYEDLSAKFNSALVARDNATEITTHCAPTTELKEPEIQPERSSLAPVHQRTLYAHVAAPKHKRRARQQRTLASAATEPSSSAAGSTISAMPAHSGGKRPTAPRHLYAPAQPSNSYATHESTTPTATTSHHDDDQGWERVQNRKTRRDDQRRRTVIRGSGVNDDELKTVERARKIHACFFTPETTAETILSYMRRKKQCDNYHVDKLKLAHSYYSSFSLTVPNSHFEFFMSAENWPTSTQVSEWFRGSGGRAGGAPRAHPAPRRQQRYARDSATSAFAATAAHGTSKQETYTGATSPASGKSTSTL